MTTQEWGVFNAEGCVERQLWSQDEAEKVAEQYRADGDEASQADLMCTEHDEQPYHGCGECDAATE